jgi:Domain of unknown function (DUF4965)/Domain of unknown function (DUF5127)/Domain of unknown function (DUF1793)/Domain of unknown function (DUF4964)
MKLIFTLVLTFCILIPLKSQSSIAQTPNFRPPSVPLVTHDPYFSIWSPADRLTDQETVHWTGAKNPLHSMIRIDGQTFRIMGASPSYIEPLKQTSLSVTPTSSVYEFGNSRIKLTLSFTSPLLANDLDVLSRPVTYISWNISSTDGQPHDIQLYFDCGSEVSVNTTEQSVKWEMPSIQGLKTAKIGCQDQKYLNKSGDNVRIDWGYAYLSVPLEQNATISINSRVSLFNSFVKLGTLPESETFAVPKNVRDGFISMAAVWNVGKVGASGNTQWVMLAYDDIYSIRYFEDDLQAYWRRNDLTFDQLLQTAAKDYNKLINSCISFDKELMIDLEKTGGKNYAQMCALVYRQCLAAQKLVADKKGQPLLFPKENFSNGCISTVDVIYPFSPFVLLFSPALTKAMLQPIMEYSASTRWKFPFAPHDLGQYPYATGQVYGGGEKDETDQMPVEETGNMIIILTALAKAEGNANYAKKYWPVIEKWADYLLSKGFDPENQLCTDDFVGHLAHNVNLSAKAIVAIASYSFLCESTNNKEKAVAYRKKAETMAKDWVRLATAGNHTLLAYDQPNTWSQKYNLVWDKLLNLNLFPREVFQKEIEFYKTMQAPFGLPLDNRERYTKNDWITWTATLAESKEDFRTIFDPVYYFAENTPNRVPVSDWYIVDNAQQKGFQARSVVGGFFIRMLSDKTIWEKWVNK